MNTNVDTRSIPTPPPRGHMALPKGVAARRVGEALSAAPSTAVGAGRLLLTRTLRGIRFTLSGVLPPGNAWSKPLSSVRPRLGGADGEARQLRIQLVANEQARSQNSLPLARVNDNAAVGCAKSSGTCASLK